MTTTIEVKSPYSIKHKEVNDWVMQVAGVCQPDQVRWCDGSKEEYDELCEALVGRGTFITTNALSLHPNISQRSLSTSTPLSLTM